MAQRCLPLRAGGPWFESMPALMIVWGQYLGRPECPYMRRWAIGPLRLHHWYRSDDKRYMHDHPSWFITLVLKGHYSDWSMYLPDVHIEDALHPGSVRFRKAEHIHYVDVKPPGCWTLLIFGRQTRDWGFWVPRKNNDGTLKFIKSNRFFRRFGHHPCDQP